MAFSSVGDTVAGWKIYVLTTNKNVLIFCGATSASLLGESMVKKLVVLSTAIIAATFSSVSLANDGLGNTLNDFYGTTNLWVGGLT